MEIPNQIGGLKMNTLDSRDLEKQIDELEAQDERDEEERGGIG